MNKKPKWKTFTEAEIYEQINVALNEMLPPNRAVFLYPGAIRVKGMCFDPLNNRFKPVIEIDHQKVLNLRLSIKRKSE